MKSLLKALCFVVVMCFVVCPVVNKMLADDPYEEPVQPICTIDCSININSAIYYVMSDYFEFNITWEVIDCTEGFECDIFIYVNSPGNQMCYRVFSIYVTQPGEITVPIGFIWGQSEAPPLESGDILCAIIDVKCNEHKTVKSDEDEEAIVFSYE